MSISHGHTEHPLAHQAERKVGKKDDTGAVGFGLLVALVFLVTVIATALILGPPRADHDLRLERPSVPSEPLMPQPPRLPRQVA